MAQNQYHVNVAAFPTVTGLILAGGQARRMGGTDKGLIEYRQRPLIEHVIDALSPQTERLVINANRHREIYQSYGYPVINDDIDGYQGPLAGMLAGLRQSDSDFLLTAPCDCPFINSRLRRRMLETLLFSDKTLAVATDGERIQPVFSLLPTRLKDSLAAFLDSGERKIDAWLYQHAVAEVDFSDCPEMFTNLNHPEDLNTPLTHFQNIPVLGLAAYSGTGKTTLLTKLIPSLHERGIRVAVVKHAHHNFDIDTPGKDSYEIRQAGASQVVIASSRLLALMQPAADPSSDPALIDCLARVDTTNVDLILVEGFKKAPIRKIELHRPSLGKPLMLPEDDNIIAVFSDTPVNTGGRPCVDLNQLDEISDFILKTLDCENP